MTKTKLYYYRAHVDRVVDGDTIDLAIDLGFKVQIRERIRLYGVNTPETRTRDLREKAAGLAAKKFVLRWLEKHHELMVQTRKDKRGKFGRMLAVLMPVGSKISLNDMLLKHGHAKPYFGGKR